MGLRFSMLLLALFVVASTTQMGVGEPTTDSAERSDDHAAAPHEGDPDAPGDAPEDEERGRPVGVPVAGQLIPDSHGGGTRTPVNARHLLRRPGITELPGLHNHGLGAWLEWQIAQARLASTSMSIVAPPIHPHAPPTRR